MLQAGRQQRRFGLCTEVALLQRKVSVASCQAATVAQDLVACVTWRVFFNNRLTAVELLACFNLVAFS
jgi:hypothetical protein